MRGTPTSSSREPSPGHGGGLAVPRAPSPGARPRRDLRGDHRSPRGRSARQRHQQGRGADSRSRHAGFQDLRRGRAAGDRRHAGGRSGHHRADSELGWRSNELSRQRRGGTSCFCSTSPSRLRLLSSGPGRPPGNSCWSSFIRRIWLPSRPTRSRTADACWSRSPPIVPRSSAPSIPWERHASCSSHGRIPCAS